MTYILMCKVFFSQVRYSDIQFHAYILLGLEHVTT